MKLPCKSVWISYLRFLTLFLLVFLPVYAGAGYFNSRFPERARIISLSWEAGVPLVPVMVWPYLSLYFVYAIPLLTLRPREINRLTIQSIVAVLVSGAIFLIFPTRAGFQKVPADMTSDALRAVAAIDTPFNLIPSLHVVCAALILFSCASASSRGARVLMMIWLVLLAASTFFVHQHHLIDIVTAVALAYGVRRLIPIDEREAS